MEDMRKQATRAPTRSHIGDIWKIPRAQEREDWLFLWQKEIKNKKHTEPGTVVVANAQPKQCNEYIDVCVVFHTVTVETPLVVTRSQKVQPLYRGVYFSALWT